MDDFESIEAFVLQIKSTLKHSFQPFFQFWRGKTKQKTGGSFVFQQLKKKHKKKVLFFQPLKLFFQWLMFFLVFFQQLKVWTMEESQVEAVCELRWTMTSANFQGVETSSAV